MVGDLFDYENTKTSRAKPSHKTQIKRIYLTISYTLISYTINQKTKTFKDQKTLEGYTILMEKNK